MEQDSNVLVADTLSTRLLATSKWPLFLTTHWKGSFFVSGAETRQIKPAFDKQR